MPTSAAAAILSAAGAQAGGLPNFANNQLQSQLAAANAALLRGALPTTARVSAAASNGPVGPGSATSFVCIAYLSFNSGTHS